MSKTYIVFLFITAIALNSAAMIMPGVYGGGYGVVRGPGMYAPPGYTMGMNMNQPGMMPPSYSYPGGGMGMGGGYGQGGYGQGGNYGQGGGPMVDPSSQNNFLVTEANKVIARWENNKTQDDAVTDFTASYAAIKKDRDILTKFINSQTADPTNAQKVQQLLNLVEMKVVIQEVESAQKTSLPNLIFALTSSQTNEDPSVKMSSGSSPNIIINRDWIMAKLKQLQNLLSGFSNLLNSSPNLIQNLPDELVGLDSKYPRAQQIMTYLHQQLNCYTDPTQAYCIAIDPKTQKNSQNSNSQGLSQADLDYQRQQQIDQGTLDPNAF
ncbi:MAG: hypothetical protein WCG05_03005 [Alphaproteobacteria bacterium]